MTYKRTRAKCLTCGRPVSVSNVINAPAIHVDVQPGDWPLGHSAKVYVEPESCPECGSEDAEYLPHEVGCPSGYPTRESSYCYCGRPAGPHPVSAHGPSLAQIIAREPV